MIRLISGAQRAQFPNIIDAMYRGRAQVFGDRLGWDVIIKNGREIDQYDDENPLYLLDVGLSGEVLGSLRLMPTTGRTLLTEVFASHFNEPVDIRSPLIWEGSRYCVHNDILERTPSGINLTTVRLFMAMCEIGLAAGLSQIIGIYDPRLVKIYRRIGWSPTPLAHSDHFPHSRIYVGLWDISPAALANMAALSGIEGSVIEGTADHFTVAVA